MPGRWTNEAARLRIGNKRLVAKHLSACCSVRQNGRSIRTRWPWHETQNMVITKGTQRSPTRSNCVHAAGKRSHERECSIERAPATFLQKAYDKSHCCYCRSATLRPCDGFICRTCLSSMQVLTTAGLSMRSKTTSHDVQKKDMLRVVGASGSGPTFDRVLPL